jgi:hypothetical protein
MAVKLLIHTDTFIAGEPVAAGTVVEVDEATAMRLAIRGVVVEGGPEVGEEIQTADPEPVHRDPKGKKHK